MTQTSYTSQAGGPAFKACQPASEPASHISLLSCGAVMSQYAVLPAPGLLVIAALNVSPEQCND